MTVSSITVNFYTDAHMVAATTVFGLIPVVADRFHSAMAATVMCVLAIATLLTMVTILVHYALFFRLPKPGGADNGLNLPLEKAKT